MRKYKPVEKINSIAEFEVIRKQKRMFFDNIEKRAVSPGYYEEYPLRIIRKYIKAGNVSVAGRIE